jgi:hypothetical protein
MKEHVCTKECERTVVCTICGRRKPPIGRDVAAAAHGSYCEHECEGHNIEPFAGHLWPGKLSRLADEQAEMDQRADYEYQQAEFERGTVI